MDGPPEDENANPSEIDRSNMDAGSSQSSSPSNPAYISPIRTGRTIREVSKEIDDLRKENFKLKLHIYFMEEKITDIGGYENLKNVKIDVQSHIEIADLQKEIQSLQQELDEKNRLLTESREALNMKESDLRLSALCTAELRDKINKLTQEVPTEDENFYSPVDSEADVASREICDSLAIATKLPSEVAVGVIAEEMQLQHDLNKLEQELENGVKELETARKRISELEEENADLHMKSIKKSKSIQALSYELQKAALDEKDDMLQIIKSAITAAERGNTFSVVSAVEELKKYFAQILSEPVEKIFDLDRSLSSDATFKVPGKDSKVRYERQM